MKQLELSVLDPPTGVAPVVPLDQKIREELLALMIAAIVMAYARSSEESDNE